MYQSISTVSAPLNIEAFKASIRCNLSVSFRSYPPQPETCGLSLRPWGRSAITCAHGGGWIRTKTTLVAREIRKYERPLHMHGAGAILHICHGAGALRALRPRTRGAPRRIYGTVGTHHCAASCPPPAQAICTPILTQEKGPRTISEGKRTLRIPPFRRLW